MGFRCIAAVANQPYRVTGADSITLFDGNTPVFHMGEQDLDVFTPAVNVYVVTGWMCRIQWFAGFDIFQSINSSVYRAGTGAVYRFPEDLIFIQRCGHQNRSMPPEFIQPYNILGEIL